MRQNKYKVWDKIEKEWLEGAEALEVYWLNGELVLFVGIEFADHRNQDEFKILQYTGLKDKDGVEAYEGDIVLLPSPSGADSKALVTWDEEGAGFSLKGFGENSDWHCDYYRKLFWLRKFIIIGNAHQNPELLENK